MKHTNIADFDDEGSIVKLNIHPHSFKVDFKTYFDGGKGLTSKEWEQVFFKVSSLLEKDYGISCTSTGYEVIQRQEYIPTVEEKQTEIKELCAEYINEISWRVERYNTQNTLGINTSDNEETYLAILRYMQYLRDYDEQSGEWWIETPKTFEEWNK